MWNELEVPFHLRNFRFWLVSRLNEVEALTIEDQPEALLMELYVEEHTAFVKAVSLEKRARDTHYQQRIIHHELARLEDRHEQQRRRLQEQYGYTEHTKFMMYDLQHRQRQERDMLHQKLRHLRSY